MPINKPKMDYFMGKHTIEYIYQIHVEGMGDLPLYIDRAKDPKARLRKHLNESKTGTSKKCQVFRQLLSEGYKLEVMVLETVDVSIPSSAEDLHITNAQGKGYELLNSKRGDTDRHVFIADDAHVVRSWSSQLIDDIKWSPDYFACRAGERGGRVKGISFYRKGWSKLRFVHPTRGHVEVKGFDWKRLLENCVAKLTT